MITKNLVALAAAGTLLFSACGGGAGSASPPTGGATPVPTGGASANPGEACAELNILTWEGFTQDHWKVPFEEKFGVKVNSTYLVSGDEEVAKLSAGGDLYDLATVSTDIFGALLQAGTLQPIDRGRVTTLGELPDFLVKLGEADGNLYNVPWNWDANPFMYDPTVLTTPPTSWEVLWDPALKGKVAVWDDSSLIYIAATALGFDKDDPQAVFDLSDEQLDAVLQKLIELKPNIRKIWSSGGELQSLWENQEVAAGLGWTYIANLLIADGVSVKTATFGRHGAHAWMDGWGIPKGSRAECQDLAYEWINWTTSKEVMAQEGEFLGYSPANGGAKDLLPAELVTKLHLDDIEAFGETIVFKVNPVRRDKYVEILNEFKAASGG